MTISSLKGSAVPQTYMLRMQKYDKHYCTSPAYPISISHPHFDQRPTKTLRDPRGLVMTGVWLSAL